MAGQTQRSLHQSRAKATTRWSPPFPLCRCVLGGSADTIGPGKETGETLMESTHDKQNPACSSRRGKVEEFPLQGHVFQSALQQGGGRSRCPTRGGACRAHPHCCMAHACTRTVHPAPSRPQPRVQRWVTVPEGHSW